VKQRYAVPVVLLTLAATVAACTDEPTQPRETRHTIGKGDEYVALGDSYTAAPGTGPKVANNGCFNTTVNYPHRVAAATGATLVDNSCNGATTNALTVPQLIRNGTDETDPQLDAVDEGTDLVTMRLGANDYFLYSRIIQCAFRFSADAPGTPCADFDASGGEASLDSRLGDLRNNLDRGLASIQDRAPDAEVIVIGYPRVAPDEGTCDLLPVPADDYEYVRRIIEGINAALEDAAEAADVTFIDMYAVSEGHDICGDEPWIAGAPTGPDGSLVVPEGATRWHPYAAEGQVVAELVLAELEEQ